MCAVCVLKRGMGEEAGKDDKQRGEGGKRKREGGRDRDGQRMKMCECDWRMMVCVCVRAREILQVKSESAFEIFVPHLM